MTNTLRPREFFGSQSLERASGGFTAALRKATIPPENVAEHSHAGAHLILALDHGYLSAAARDSGPSNCIMLVYNPPGTVHCDRFAQTGGRFLSIDVADRLIPNRLMKPRLIRSEPALQSAARIAGLVSSKSGSDLEMEDLILIVMSGLTASRAHAAQLPAWLKTGSEALTELASDSALRIRDIAHYVGVHPVHFARTFRQHFGHSPGDALRSQRLKSAATMLSSNAHLAEVAIATGFADQSHMTRAFRRDYGVTPAVFRASFN